MVKNVRMRLLLVMQVLTEQTDEKHGLTMKEILEWIHRERNSRRA